MSQVCSWDECVRPLYKNELCRQHYTTKCMNHALKHGTATETAEQIQARRSAGISAGLARFHTKRQRALARQRRELAAHARKPGLQEVPQKVIKSWIKNPVTTEAILQALEYAGAKVPLTVEVVRALDQLTAGDK